ncbi:MAG: hypothetical protein ACKVQK_12270 [Burkholderiales bacterium]
MSGRVNLDRWGPHLVAAKREGVSLAQYARVNGLSVYSLYAARETIRKVAGKSLPSRQSATPRDVGKLVPKSSGISMSSSSSFAPVKVVRLDAPRFGVLAQLRARLPNGVRVELIDADAEVVSAAIQALWGR